MTGVVPPSGLAVWTAAYGAIGLAQAAVPWLTGRASEDGLWVFHTEHADALTADVMVSRTDGKQSVLVAERVRLTAECMPNARFVGDQVVVSYCPSAPVDLGVGGADLGVAGDVAEHVVAWVDPAKGEVDVLRRGIATRPFYVDPRTRNILVADLSGEGWVLQPGAIPPVRVDGDVRDGLLLPDGSAAVYRTSKGALRRFPLANGGVPSTLVSTGVLHLFLPQDQVEATFIDDIVNLDGISPDGASILYASQVDPMSPFTDLLLASTSLPGPPIVVAPGNKSRLVGSPFTADSRFALAVLSASYVAQSQQLQIAGDVSAVDVKAGTTAFFGPLGGRTWAMRGSRFVFSRDLEPKRAPIDIQVYALAWADAASDAPPVIIATHVDWNYYPLPNGAGVVYTIPDGRYRGLYSYELP